MAYGSFPPPLQGGLLEGASGTTSPHRAYGLGLRDCHPLRSGIPAELALALQLASDHHTVAL